MAQFKFKVNNNQIEFINEEQATAYKQLLASFNNTGKRLIIDIQEYSRTVTQSQLNLYKAIIIEGSSKSGYSYSEFKLELENRFLPSKYEKDFLGNIVPLKTEIHELNNVQFSAFIEQSVNFMNAFFGTNFQL